MIPPFDQHGYLPSGIHLATLEEIRHRFGQTSELRRSQMESLEWLIPTCKRAGIIRLIINGSFVTDVEEPNDVDCALLAGDGYNPQSMAAAALDKGLPFLSLQIVREAAFDQLARTFFATDRLGRSKGVVEVVL